MRNQIISKFSSLFNKKKKQVSHPREQLNYFISQLSIEAENVLEIGCSFGKHIYKKSPKKWAVKNYKTMDVDPAVKADYVWDLNNDLSQNNEFSEKFNVVICFEVMEYIYDPMQAIRNIYSCLKPNGIAYISYHFIYPIHNPIEFDYLRYTPEGVKKMALECEFSDMKFTPRKSDAGQSALKAFFKYEKMQAHFDLNATYDIGFIATLIK